MGQSGSKQETREVSIEQLSHELALRFASKCYTHLEVAHFKDNFKTLADHQQDVEYWKEETLSKFLSLPDSLRSGSVLYAMITYLGAFPFPSLAPCIVTREAMLKVVTILTSRYRKVLKKGDQDKNKLLFRSLAVFDRRSNSIPPSLEKGVLPDSVKDEQASTSMYSTGARGVQTRSTGFDVDRPANDGEHHEEEEEDDDLALAALDALDAIEVFKHDQRQDRKIHRAYIPVQNFERIVVLMLLLTPLAPQDNMAAFTSGIEDDKLRDLEVSARAIISAFRSSTTSDVVTYYRYVKTMTMLTPRLFRPLDPLFEHFMYSKQLDLSKHKTNNQPEFPLTNTDRSPLQFDVSNPSTILNDVLLAQLSFSLEIAPTNSPAATSFFHSHARISQLYSTSSHGTSLSSFSRQILSWRAASLLVLKGTHPASNEPYLLGAYIPEHWQDTSHRESDPPPSKQSVLFQLAPRQAVFRANPYNTSTPTTHFSTKTGIALGCVIPATSRINAASQMPILGPVSLLIDGDISSAVFQHDGSAGTGAFLTDPLLEEDQTDHPQTTQPRKLELDIDALEVWGISFPAEGDEDAFTKQKKLLEWEEAEAARRRGVNFGGDKDGARHLLEMAGLVGDSATSRSGGSMG